VPGNCCKHEARVDSQELECGPSQKNEANDRGVTFRPTIQTTDLRSSDEDNEARKGVLDPAASQGTSSQSSSKGRPSFDERVADVIGRHSVEDPPPLRPKRVQGRKGTGFVKKSDVPKVEDSDDEEEDEPPKPKKSGTDRCKQRKGTGFVRKDLLPKEDEDEDEDESD